MNGKKQKLGLKRMNKVAQVLGKPLKCAFVNGDLPHDVVLGWDLDGDAWFINMKLKSFRQYVNGKTRKLLMHKLVDKRNIKLVKKENYRADLLDAVLDLPSKEWLLTRYGMDELQVKQLSSDDLKLLLDEWDADKREKAALREMDMGRTQYAPCSYDYMT